MSINAALPPSIPQRPNDQTPAKGAGAADSARRPDDIRQALRIAAARERLEAAAAMAAADGVISPEEYAQLQTLRQAYVQARLGAADGWFVISSRKREEDLASYALIEEAMQSACPGAKGDYAVDTFYAQLFVARATFFYSGKEQVKVAPHNVKELAAKGRLCVEHPEFFRGRELHDVYCATSAASPGARPGLPGVEAPKQRAGVSLRRP